MKRMTYCCVNVKTIGSCSSCCSFWQTLKLPKNLQQQSLMTHERLINAISRLLYELYLFSGGVSSRSVRVIFQIFRLSNDKLLLFGGLRFVLPLFSAWYSCIATENGSRECPRILTWFANHFSKLANHKRPKTKFNKIVFTSLAVTARRLPDL